MPCKDAIYCKCDVFLERSFVSLGNRYSRYLVGTTKLAPLIPPKVLSADSNTSLFAHLYTGVAEMGRAGQSVGMLRIGTLVNTLTV